MNKKQTASEKPDMLVPIKWRIPEGISTPFATNMLVQIMESEFKLLFFEVKPPLILDESEPKPSSAIADYIGGVIVGAERLPKFIEVLQRQLDKYNKLKETGKLPKLM